MNRLSEITSRHKRRWLMSCAALAFGACVVVQPYAYALDVNGQVKKEYARITFDWGENVDISPSSNGRDLTIKLGKSDTVPVDKLRQQLAPYVTDIEQINDGSVLVVRMKEPYPTRSFVSEDSNGVDIIFSGNSPRPKRVVELGAPVQTAKNLAREAAAKEKLDQKIAVAQVKAKRELQISAAIPIPIPKPVFKEDKPSDVSASPQNETSEPKAEAVVAIPETTVEIQPDIPKVDIELSETMVEKAAVGSNTQKEAPPVEVVAKLAEEEINKLKRKDEKKKSPTNVTSAAAQPQPSKADKLKELDSSMLVSVKKDRASVNLFFPFHERTAAAVFYRGKDVFLVFSSKRDVNLDKLASVLPGYIDTVQQLHADDATILRFVTSVGHIYPTMLQTRRGYEWVLQMDRRAKTPEHLAVPETVSRRPINPHVNLAMLQTSDPVDFVHPVTGEEYIAIPSYAENSGVFPERILPDVIVLRTGQGAALVKKDPDINVIRLRAGVRITKPNGLTMTQDLAAIPDDQLALDKRSNTFFPYNDWKVENSSLFFAKERELLSEITTANDRQVSALRLKLAQLYMSESMHVEALALLSIIKQEAPEFYDDNQLAAMAGGLRFMTGNVVESDRDFRDETVVDEEEMQLWHRILETMQGKRRTLDYFKYNRLYVQHYPPDMRRRIALLAADNALSLKKYESVFNILNSLEPEVFEPIEAYAQYMIGRIYAEKGDMDLAEETLEPLSKDFENHFVRARSGFTLATSKYKANLLTRPELIEELEKLKYVWRGDAFEVNLLNLLGELYINNEQYLDGLRAWRSIASLFPNSAAAQSVSARMGQTFISLFNDGAADTLTPLEALALYYEFRELTPLGREGDVMVQNLATRLADVDLLGRAAALLEHQVTFRLEKEERSRVGAKLALIYLLDRKPQNALDVLELTGYGDNDEMLMRERNHLAAMGYADLGEWQRGLNLLRDDFSRDTKFLRTDIFWENKDWDNVSLTIEDILQTRTDITAPLTEEETEALIRLGIAYSFRNEPEQLQYLRDYFMPLVTDVKRRETFDFVTSGIDPVNRDSIATLSKEMGKMKSFLDNYRIKLREEKLSAVF